MLSHFTISILMVAFICAMYLFLKILSSHLRRLNLHLFRRTTPFSVLAIVPPRSRITAIHGLGLTRLNEKGIYPSQLEDEAVKFVMANSNATDSVRSTLEAFFDATLADYLYLSKDARSIRDIKRWLLITITKISGPSRWHRDIPYHGGRPGQTLSRYSMTLVGPPTIVLRPSGVVDAAMNRFAPPDPKTLTQQPREEIETGQIYRFTIGRADSPVHTTPEHRKDRIFVSVVYY